MPSRDWLGIVKSPRARSKIRAYFSKITRNDDQVRGRDLVMHELRKDGVGVAAAKALPYLESVAVELSYESTDDLLVAVGSGKYSAKQLAHRIIHAMNKEAEAEEEADKPVIDQLYLTNGSNITAKPRSPQERSRRSAHNKTGIVVKGLDDVYVRLSHCCNPLPGDDIIGFITRGRGVSVHRADCPKCRPTCARNPERMIDVAWEAEDRGSVYQVENLRRGHRPAAPAAGHRHVRSRTPGVNIVSCSTTTTHKDEIVEMRFVFEVGDLSTSSARSSIRT